MRRQAVPLCTVVIAFTTLGAACGGGEDAPPAGQTIARDVFIEAYVDLRIAALAAEDFVVTPEQREQILARHEVDEEGLLQFADVHGGDVDFMNEIWADVERLLEARMPSEDSA